MSQALTDAMLADGPPQDDVCVLVAHPPGAGS
jgi:hypothetical protein